jgi:HSP20 family protein
MAETETKVPLKKSEGTKTPATAHAWSPFANLRGEIERLFDEFAPGWPFTGGRAGAMDFPRFDRFSMPPAVEASENGKEYVITAELPGLDEKDIEVALSDGALTIRGEKKEEKEEKAEGSYFSERRYGAFERRFSIPDGIDHDRIEASLKKGVLKVVLPKTAEAQKKARKIQVRAK